jgi:simple sugar transport system permease protein
MAGLVGMSTLLGFTHRYVQDFPSGFGFTGIAVALLGRNHPVGIAFGALLFGFLERSSIILDLENVPREIVTIFFGVVVLAVVIVYEVVARYATRRAVAAAARATAELEEAPAA